MQFGRVDNPEQIDFCLPEDHPGTKKVLQGNNASEKLRVYVGCAKWNRQDLKNFYPRGTKDELTYYSTQFNSIELNATFYQMYNAQQMAKWSSKTPEDFRFFPKIPQIISHIRRLEGAQEMVEAFCNNLSAFSSRLGMVFLQLHDNFAPKNFDRLERFIENFPGYIPLAVELRNTEWYNDHGISERLYALFEEHHITNIITDTAGRRDLMHMRLTSPVAFIRYVGANHPSDYTRLDDWLERLDLWIKQGLRDVYFFVHQNLEKESPLLSMYFIKRLNQRFKLNLKIPATQNSGELDFG